MKPETITKLNYLIHKKWLEAVFSREDWKSRTGREIMNECRELGHSIGSKTFYRIRREILGQERIIPCDYDPFEDEHIRRFSKLKRSE